MQNTRRGVAVMSGRATGWLSPVVWFVLASCADPLAAPVAMPDLSGEWEGTMQLRAHSATWVSYGFSNSSGEHPALADLQCAVALNLSVKDEVTIDGTGRFLGGYPEGIAYKNVKHPGVCPTDVSFRLELRWEEFGESRPRVFAFTGQVIDNDILASLLGCTYVGPDEVWQVSLSGPQWHTKGDSHFLFGGLPDRRYRNRNGFETSLNCADLTATFTEFASLDPSAELWIGGWFGRSLP